MLAVPLVPMCTILVATVATRCADTTPSTFSTLCPWSGMKWRLPTPIEPPCARMPVEWSPFKMAKKTSSSLSVVLGSCVLLTSQRLSTFHGGRTQTLDGLMSATYSVSRPVRTDKYMSYFMLQMCVGTVALGYSYFPRYVQ